METDLEELKKKIEDKEEQIKKVEGEVKELPAGHPERTSLQARLTALTEEKAALEQRLTVREEKELLLLRQAAAAAQPPAAQPAAYVERWRLIRSPSTLPVYKEQVDGDALFCDGRPPASIPALPPQAIRPEFGVILDAMRTQAPPSPESLELGEKLIKCCSKYYSLENEMRGPVLELLREWLGQSIDVGSLVRGRRAEVDGVVTDKPGAPYDAQSFSLILEVKPWMGGGSGKRQDAWHEGATYYGSGWAHRSTTPLFNTTYCPALLVEVLGPTVRVSALYWLDKVCMVPLTPVLNTVLLPHDTHQILTLARVLDALRRAVCGLGTYYSDTAQPASAASSGSGSVAVAGTGQHALPPVRHEQDECFLPYPLREKGQFSECSPLQAGSAVYRAVDKNTGRRVVIKCVFQPYGEDVHKAWAAAGAAPQLLELCTYPGGMQVVVMEDCAPEEGWVMLADLQGPEARAGCKAAQQALQRVHEQAAGKVHGDTRVANTMVNLRDGNCSVRFIDFERSGQEGTKCYPPFMNPDICWPAGVKCGLPLRQQHDVDLLSDDCVRLLGMGVCAPAGSKQRLQEEVGLERPVKRGRAGT